MIRRLLRRWLLGDAGRRPPAGPSNTDIADAIEADGLSRRRLDILAGRSSLSIKELEQASIDGANVRDMAANHPGWKAFMQRMKLELQLQKNAAFALSPEDWNSARGLQQKGQVVQLEAMLMLHAQMIAEGMKAEKALAEVERQRKAQEEADRPKGRRIH